MSVAESPVLGTCLAGLRILVVDDNDDTLVLARTFLHIYGAEVVTASSAAEAFELLVDDPPDMLISDIDMPGEDGYRFLRRVRAQSRAHGGRTPALAITCHTRLFDRARSRAAGFQAQLSKLVDLEEFITTVAHVAGRAA